MPRRWPRLWPPLFVLTACANDAPTPAPPASPAAPSKPAAALEQCNATLGQLFSTRSLPPPTMGDNRYASPSAAQRRALSHTLRRVHAKRWGSAAKYAARAGYVACLATPDVVVLRPRRSTAAYARVALRLGPARPLILEAPHPFHDSRTAYQARRMFEDLAARALIIAGVYRCSNLDESTIGPGKTRVCGQSSRFVISDMAHNPDSMFQRAHETLYAMDRTAFAVSVHGMGANGVSISNGTQRPVSKDAPVAQLAEALKDALANETPRRRYRVTTCNGYPGADVRYHLCGLTNTQARYSLGRGLQSAGANTYRSRFIHLEQSMAVRRKRALVTEAFDAWLARAEYQRARGGPTIREP